MDREERDPLRIFRRGLEGGPTEASPHPPGGFAIGDGMDLATLIAAQGKVLALFAMLLDRERILKAEELGRMIATIAAVTSQQAPAEGDILAIWAAGVQDVAAGL